MDTLFATPSILITVLSVITFVMQGFGFVDAATHPPRAYEAADKLTKPAWLIFLGIGLAYHMLFWNILGLVNLLGIVAAIVYLVDVRPRVREVMGR